MGFQASGNLIATEQEISNDKILFDNLLVGVLQYYDRLEGDISFTTGWCLTRSAATLQPRYCPWTKLTADQPAMATHPYSSGRTLNTT